MKTTFKPLGLAAAVAAATAGYAGIVNAQSATLAGNSGLGDLAIVPYYTVQKEFSTGVSIINTSSDTQVVKIRLRRAADSMDALDFNVILSPNDVYTGYVQLGPDGEEIRFYSNDNSCTAPAYNGTDGQYFVMPSIYREGAEEGYIEVIGMAAAEAGQPIYASSLHAAGVPANCARVRDNFFPGVSDSDYGSTVVDPTRKGVISSVVTNQLNDAGTGTVSNTYVDTGNVLKVSYFIKSDASGLEFGNDAVHIADFMSGPSMTNQKFGIFEGDLQGFDYPDLNGGAVFSSSVIDNVAGAAQRGAYEPLRDAIGGVEVLNDWSKNTTDAFSVDTDWVVTTPGQYVMTNLFAYLASIAPTSTTNCLGGDPATPYDPATGVNCDFRDIPMTAAFTVYDREERGITVAEGDLVVSPQPPGEITVDVLDSEVNVIQWGDFDVLGAEHYIEVPVPEGAQAGWANLGVIQWGGTTQAVCDFTGLAPGSQPTVAAPIPVACVSTDTPVPLVGFVAWQRNFQDMPASNYGRIIEHSYTVVSVVAP